MQVLPTPGQRRILEILQRKLLDTVEIYARISKSISENVTKSSEEELESPSEQREQLELTRIKNKIKKIAAKQKYLTREIMHGNGNNSITKENYLNALGLVTKEVSSRIKSKPSERRRRTTANPRFSHEAIQAKKALEPYLKRLEPRIRRQMILYS